MYQHFGELWPQKEPITGREVCRFCWNQDHQHCGLMFDGFGYLQCDHFREHLRHGNGRSSFAGCECKFECDCVHLSEQSYADQERANRLANGRERRKLMRSMRDDERNPLRAVNPEYQPPLKGKKPQA